MVEKDLCVICLQKKKLKKRPQRLDLLQLNVCECKSLVHKLCLQQWHNKSYSCPICRVSLYLEVSDSESEAEAEAEAEAEEENIRLQQAEPWFKSKRIKLLGFGIGMWSLFFATVWFLKSNRSEIPKLASYNAIEQEMIHLNL
jgi:hypothetical protein